MSEKICISDMTLDRLTAYAPSKFLNGCIRSL